MFRFHSQTLALATVAALLPCATAQAQSSKVIPPSATTTEGSGSYAAGRNAAPA